MKYNPHISIEEAILRINAGKIVIVTDDEARENEGDFIMAADCVTPEAINFMITHGRGLVCVSATTEKLDKMKIPLMAASNTARLGTAFTVSIDALQGTTTGISAQDRCETIRQFCSPQATLEQFGVPGHIFPLRAQNGGVLRRSGHTEASSDLAALAGYNPIGILCEILNADGTMARVPDLEKLAEEHQLGICTVADLISYRRRTECLIKETVVVDMPTEFGNFKLHLFESCIDEQYHLAFVLGNPKADEPTLVRVHSECLTGDIFHSLRCDCGSQLKSAMNMISEAGCGVLLYMRQEGRGIGLKYKLQAYKLQEAGLDTVDANIKLGFAPDLRDYGFGAQMLKALGLNKIKLLTNNPCKIAGLSGYNVEVVERIPLKVSCNKHNKKYIDTKIEKFGHLD